MVGPDPMGWWLLVLLDPFAWGPPWDKAGGSEICPDFSRAGLCLPASEHLPSEVTSPRAELGGLWRVP